jgi:hypothetical protein
MLHLINGIVFVDILAFVPMIKDEERLLFYIAVFYREILLFFFYILVKRKFYKMRRSLKIAVS